MQGERVVISALNRYLALLLVSINRSFLHARISKNWGFHKLGGQFYRQSIDDMKRADSVIERTLLLDALPHVYSHDKMVIGDSVPAMLQADIDALNQTLAVIAEAVQLAEQERDYVSRELLEQHQYSHEEYLDWLLTQQELIQSMGLQDYLQTAL